MKHAWIGMMVALAPLAGMAEDPALFSKQQGCLSREIMMSTPSSMGISAAYAAACGIAEKKVEDVYLKSLETFGPCFAAEKITEKEWRLTYETARKDWAADQGFKDQMSFAESKKATCDAMQEQFANP